MPIYIVNFYCNKIDLIYLSLNKLYNFFKT